MLVSSEVSIHSAMAAQPAIRSVPPMGASFLRRGSPVRAWWYRAPQKSPIPAVSRPPACTNHSENRVKLTLYKCSTEHKLKLQCTKGQSSANSHFLKLLIALLGLVNRHKQNLSRSSFKSTNTVYTELKAGNIISKANPSQKQPTDPSSVQTRKHSGVVHKVYDSQIQHSWILEHPTYQEGFPALSRPQQSQTVEKVIIIGRRVQLWTTHKAEWLTCFVKQRTFYN